MQEKSIRSHGFCFGALFIKDMQECGGVVLRMTIDL